MTTHLDDATLLAMSTDCACFTVRKTARALTSLYDRVLAPTGLRTTQATLLVALARAGDIPVTRLAGILGLDRTTLTRNLAPLERDGLVGIRPGPDRRIKLAGITEAGRKVLAAAMPLWREAQRQITSAAGAARWETLRRELGRITALADEAGAGTGDTNTHHRRQP
jgi:DNA-binding MarR family transcriptional regulator